MKTKSKAVVYARRTKIERGVFECIIGLFLRVPDSVAERRRRKDRREHV